MKQPTTTQLLKEIDKDFAANGDRPMNSDERHACRWIFAWVLTNYDLTPKESEATHG